MAIKQPTISHLSHGMGEHVTGGAVPGNVARDGAPKRVTAIAVHDGMSKQTKSGAVALGGDHASAIDSLTGRETVPGARNVATPGFGNGGLTGGHPLAKPPGSKAIKPAAVAFGQRGDTTLHELGAAMIAQAFAASAPDDRQAHGRDRTGRK